MRSSGVTPRDMLNPTEECARQCRKPAPPKAVLAGTAYLPLRMMGASQRVRKGIGTGGA
jgi:hypothetical protein